MATKVIWCNVSGCKLRSKFNVPGSEYAKFCDKHMENGMIHIRQTGCRYCPKRACYGYLKGKGLACKEHISDGMFDVVHDICKHPECNTRPSYNYEGKSKGLFCAIHRENDMVIVTAQKCEEPKCKKQPTFNFPTEIRARFCFTHQKTGMIDVKHNTCQHPECNTRPSYNYEGKTKGLFCTIHKQEGMVLLYSSTCEEPMCKKQPSYNYEGKEVKYCVDHKKDQMVDVRSKKCEEPNCGKQPSCNFKGETVTRYCTKHKLQGMINIKSKKCEYLGCTTEPVYNYKDQTRGRYCFEHKENDMINIKDKRCKHDGCEIIPNYNFEGETKAIYCRKHQEDKMVNVKDRRCKTLLCDVRGTSKYQGYCFRCFVYTFPDSPLTRNYKTKELYVVNRIQEFITKNYPELKITFDKKVDGGCSLRRPDMFIELLTHVVIIEVDENQHKQTSCETLRLVQLFEDVAQRPCVFIRFNPDAYIDAHGVRHKSCFRYTDKGLCVIDSDEEMSRRLVPVYEALRTYLVEPQEKLIHVEQYWYNEIEEDSDEEE